MTLRIRTSTSEYEVEVEERMFVVKKIGIHSGSSMVKPGEEFKGDTISLRRGYLTVIRDSRKVLQTSSIRAIYYV